MWGAMAHVSARLSSGSQVEHKDRLGSRVMEIFTQYDTKRAGKLDKKALYAMFKTLGPSFENAEIEALIVDLDTSNDGDVSHKELVDWIKKGTALSKTVINAILNIGDARDRRIKQTFSRYDVNGNGSLSVSELTKVLTSLGAFTPDEIKKVVADLDTSGDGEASFEEFEAWIKNGKAKKEILKAKAILAPSDNDGFEAVFYNFCGAGRYDMDGRGFLKMVKDCGLIDKRLNERAVDIIFSKAKPKGAKSIDFERFEHALSLIVDAKGEKKETVHIIIMESSRSIMQGTKAEAVRFHDDPKAGAQSAHAGTGQPSLARAKKSHGRRRPASSGGDRHSMSSKAGHPDVPVDNTELWKVFGVGTKAGRTLKRVYSDPSVRSPCRPGSDAELPRPRHTSSLAPALLPEIRLFQGKLSPSFEWRAPRSERG